MKDKQYIKHLIELYLQGKATLGQQHELLDYLNISQQDDAEIDQVLEKIWIEEPAERDDSEVAMDDLQNIRRKIEHRQQVKSLKSILKYAATIIVIFTAGVVWYRFKDKQAESSEELRMMTKVTGPGEKVKLLLPDSSVVYLGGMSKITWASYFAKGQARNITLEGEAFFEVRHDAKRPFIVQSSNLRTQVLGTSFNIYAYPHDNTFSVAVRTGKVGVLERIKGKAGRTLSLLTPGMKLIYQNQNQSFTINNETATNTDSWVSNRFSFRNESLKDMLQKLERYYNVKFELKTKGLGSCRFNATFANKNVNEVMEQLKIMTGGKLSYKVDHQKITLWGEACQ